MAPSGGMLYLPLDDCVYALQSTIPHLRRSSLNRCFQRHETDGDKPKHSRFKADPIGDIRR